MTVFMMMPTETQSIQKKKKQSLNEMILNSLAQLQENQNASNAYATARDITDHIQNAYGVDYPIQTIIVVLNRLVKRGLITRVLSQSDDVRHRYSFYLNQSPGALREERMIQRFKAFVDEFFQGDLQRAFGEIQKLLSKL